MLRVNQDFASRIGIKSNVGKLSKFRSVRTEIDGYKFDSILEANYYRYLKILKMTGDVKYFLRQVPFKVSLKSESGNCSIINYRCDFFVFYTDGRQEVIDVKGFETKDFKKKKKIIESEYPVVIKLVKRGEF